MDISAYKHMNIRMSTRGKRPLRNLTPSDKVRAIQRIHNGETKASVSRDIGVPESTLRGWCKNEQKLRFMCRQLGTDQMLVRGQGTPPEKRLKFDSGGGVSASQKTGIGSTTRTDFEYGCNRLQLAGAEYVTNSDILEKMAFAEFCQKSSLRPEVVRCTSTQVSPATKHVAIPAEYSQLAMLQSFNFLSLLNFSSAPSTAFGSNKLDECQPKAPIHEPAVSVDDFMNISNRRSSSSDGSSSSSAVLSVKNWARDPAKNSTALQANEGTPNNPNLRDVKPSGHFSAPGLKTETAFMPTSLPGSLSAAPNSPNSPNSPDNNTESANVALMDWCKLFNASLHYLALSAAAATLQQNVAAGFGATEDLCGKDSSQEGFSDNNNLLKHLAKHSHSLTLQGKRMGASDVSNDSYFDSEPEDLSVPSTSCSKRSSPSNSCSRSPTVLSSSSVHSDAD